MISSRTHYDLAREKQDYAARQDRMVLADDPRLAPRVVVGTPEEQAEISRLILSGAIYGRNKQMTTAAEPAAKPTSISDKLRHIADWIDAHDCADEVAFAGSGVGIRLRSLEALKRMFPGRQAVRSYYTSGYDEFSVLDDGIKVKAIAECDPPPKRKTETVTL